MQKLFSEYLSREFATNMRPRAISSPYERYCGAVFIICNNLGKIFVRVVLFWRPVSYGTDLFAQFSFRYDKWSVERNSLPCAGSNQDLLYSPTV